MRAVSYIVYARGTYLLKIIIRFVNAGVVFIEFKQKIGEINSPFYFETATSRDSLLALLYI